MRMEDRYVAGMFMVKPWDVTLGSSSEAAHGSPELMSAVEVLKNRVSRLWIARIAVMSKYT